jgi:hypothetical protein
LQRAPFATITANMKLAPDFEGKRLFSVLVTNITLRNRTGTELMTVELARGLLARGHRVAVYSPRLGPLATKLRGFGVPVTDQISKVAFCPDVIHGHHNTALAVAMARFQSAPAIFVCHDSSLIYDSPLVDPRVMAYVAVDEACRERLLIEGAPDDRIHLVPNAVDLSSFRCRDRWEEQPRRALAVTKANAPWLEAARAACRRKGIELDEVGPAVQNSVDDLPTRMAASDIVFAWSRSAAEAAATGAGVILTDEFGFGGLLTVAEAQNYPASMLGRRGLGAPASEADFVRAIEEHSVANAHAVAKAAHRKLSLTEMLAKYEALYQGAIEGPVSEASRLHDFFEAALPRFDLAPDLICRGEALAARLLRLDAWIGANPDRALPLGKLKFDNASEAVGLLATGWAEPEDWGCWSTAPVAAVDLPISVIDRWGGRIAVACEHYFPDLDAPASMRPVEVRVGGWLVARWHFIREHYSQPQAPRMLLLPEALWRGRNGALRLAFHCPKSCAPIDTGGVDDPRQLGIGLISFSQASD